MLSVSSQRKHNFDHQNTLLSAFRIRVARWPGTKDAKFFLKSCQKLPNRFFLTMTSQNSHACVLRPEVSYSSPRIKVGSVDRDIKNHFSIAK